MNPQQKTFVGAICSTYPEIIINLVGLKPEMLCEMLKYNPQYFLVSTSLQFMKGEVTILKVFSDRVEMNQWVKETLKGFGELLDETKDGPYSTTDAIEVLAEGYQVHLYTLPELLEEVPGFFESVESRSLEGLIKRDFTFWFGENALATKWKEEVVASIVNPKKHKK